MSGSFVTITVPFISRWAVLMLSSNQFQIIYAWMKDIRELE